MKTFEDFVASREQLDPSARKMTEHQWEQAYAAYRSSRERVRKPATSGESKGSGVSQSKRMQSSSVRSRGTHQASSATGASALRQQVRAQSAYGDFRLMIDLLVWVVIGVIIVETLFKMSMMTNVYVTMSSLPEGAIGVLIAYISKHLIHVVIDIPDIALYQSQKEQRHTVSRGDESAS
ncbi:MAG: hypothetical protein ACN4GF_08745 [Lentimonas sp.]